MHKLKPSVLVIVLIAFVSCKKNSASTDDCFPNDEFSREITNETATVEKIDGEFYLVEQGTIDETLRPCKLDDEFKVDGLQVLISGTVKVNQYDSRVCCTVNFVITKISKL